MMSRAPRTECATPLSFEQLEPRLHFAATASLPHLGVTPTATGPTSVSGVGNAPAVTSFTLVDDAGNPVASFSTGAVINLRRFGQSINVRADVRGDVDG